MNCKCNQNSRQRFVFRTQRSVTTGWLFRFLLFLFVNLVPFTCNKAFIFPGRYEVTTDAHREPTLFFFVALFYFPSTPHLAQPDLESEVQLHLLRPCGRVTNFFHDGPQRHANYPHSVMRGQTETDRGIKNMLALLPYK